MRNNEKGRKRKNEQPKDDSVVGDQLSALEHADSESVLSGSGAPSEYEQMLQKYEAEVRNHIKIEQ